MSEEGRGGTQRRVAVVLAIAGMSLLAVPWSGAGPFGVTTNVPSAANASYNFTFDQVDLRTFVKVVSDITGRSFIVDDAVKGKVTILTPRIPVRDVYPLFSKVLESAGCAAVEADGVTRIVPFPSRANANAPIVGEEGTMPPGPGLITRVFRIRFASAGDLRKILEAMAGKEKTGNVSALEASNHLIVTDTADNLRRLEKIIREVDQPGSGIVYEAVTLKYADAQEVARQFTPVLNQQDKRVGGPLPADQRQFQNVNIVAMAHANSVVLIGSSAQVAELKKMIATIDVESPAGNGTLHVLFLNYMSAQEMATNLNALLTKPAADKTKTPDSLAEHRISIEPNTANNALLVDSSPRDFELLQKLVIQLDKPVAQVLIEVVIAELSVSDSSDIGVEMAFLDQPAIPGQTVVQGSSIMDSGDNSLLNAVQSGVFPQGITVGAMQGVRYDASGNLVSGYPALINLNAMKKKGHFRILSHVPLVTQNNGEATVNVVDNIPILKSTIQGGSGTSRDVIQNIDRIDVGIKLKLTPQVNADGQVKMVLNPCIEAIQDQGSSTVQFTPTIARREVSTTVTVPDGQTIVISGLMREDDTKSEVKVPILGSIPLLGWLFRHTVTARERTNLMILVTPNILKDAQRVDVATRDWQRRTGLSETNQVSVGNEPDFDHK